LELSLQGADKMRNVVGISPWRIGPSKLDVVLELVDYSGMNGCLRLRSIYLTSFARLFGLNWLGVTVLSELYLVFY
jgi:hypothetical protein